MNATETEQGAAAMGRLRDAFIGLEEMYVAAIDDRDRYRTALRELLAVLPPYVGLAVPVQGETNDFNAAEQRVVDAMTKARAERL